MQALKLAFALAVVGLAFGLPTATDDASHQQARPHPPRLDAQMIAALRAIGKKPSDFRLPGSVPNPDHKPGTDLLPGIDHFVMLMMENHSFDNIWGTLDRPDVDGFTFDHNGKPIPAVPQKYANGSIQNFYPMPKTCVVASNGPTQNWASSHLQYNNGSMNGFATAGGDKPIAMGYFTKEHLPFMHSLGKTFPIGDRWFTSALGQTWPNRMYLIGGTSMGIVSTGQDITGLIPPGGTIFTRLDQHNISWRNYVVGFPEVPSTPDLFTISDLETLAINGRPFEQFFADAAQGELPSFSFIDLNGTSQTQENPQNVVVGEAVMYDIVQALGSSPQWSKTLLIINYDEHGGYYDHVPPPPALAPDAIEPIPPPGGLQYEGYRRYSFRVPSVVVSPWAKKNHVSHVVYDHTSVLALLEYKWNLESMTIRDSNANNMLDFIDLDALRRGRMNFPSISQLRLSLPGNTTEALACDPRDPGVIPPEGTVQAPQPNKPSHR